MDKCRICHRDTDLYVNGQPICVECDERIHAPKEDPQAGLPRKPNASTPAETLPTLKAG
jgi:hypothetical protein